LRVLPGLGFVVRTTRGSDDTELLLKIFVSNASPWTANYHRKGRSFSSAASEHPCRVAEIRMSTDPEERVRVC